jgi:citrate lyase subunit beta/citryl-CoA lyase
VCVVGGKMVDAPVLRLAERTLARHAWACHRTSKTIATSA